MIFKPELAQKALTGEKTMARQIVKQGEYLLRASKSKEAIKLYAANRRVKWQVGRTYAIQPGRGPAIGRFKLLDIRRERVQDISEADARAELGAPEWTGPGEPPYQRDLVTCFVIKWDSINSRPGQRWDDNPEVWVLVFEVAKPAQ